MWDERYSVDEHVYGKEPNELLLEMSDRLKQGKVLCLAEGEGRNAVSIWCHVHQDLRRRLHRDVVAGLKEGGTFLLEAYTPKQLEFKTGGPPSVEYLMTLASLQEELDGLEFIHGQELVREVVEGSKHTGKGSVVQVFARKIQTFPKQ